MRTGFPKYDSAKYSAYHHDARLPIQKDQAMTVYTCPDCAELFRVAYLSGTFPGGKEREDIDCPNCGKTVDTEVTSAVVSTKALTAEEKLSYLASRQQ